MTKNPTCIYCDQGEQEAPLLQFTFRGWHYWICPQHLPILIHNPEQLVHKLPILQNLRPADGHA